MANNVSRHLHLLIFFFFFLLLLILASHHVIQGAESSTTSLIAPSRRESLSQDGGKRWVDKNSNPESPDLSLPRNLKERGKLLDVFQPFKGFPKNPRRMMIGSVAPTCTYNECKGCKYKCRAEQVPVEGNDPINSPYHYKCVCHR